MFVKDKRSTGGDAVCLPAASLPGQDGNGTDVGQNSKPKKGIIFEICSEDGFHIRSESIEGERRRAQFYNDIDPQMYMSYEGVIVQCVWICVKAT